MSNARYVITNREPDGRVSFWNQARRAWTFTTPELMTGPEADDHLARLAERVPNAKVIDWVVVCERAAVWARGYATVIDITSDKKYTAEDKFRAVSAADDAVRAAGYSMCELF